MKILFLHGLGSGENSRTAQILREAGYDVMAPELPLSPLEADRFIWEKYLEFKPDMVIGNSLGGFYALKFCDIPKLVINPVFNAAKDIAEAIRYGEHNFVKPRKNGDTHYSIDDKFINELKLLTDILYNYILGEEDNKKDTYALFGSKDTLLNNYKLFTKFYGAENVEIIPAAHRLNEKEVKEYVLPLVDKVRNIYGII